MNVVISGQAGAYAVLSKVAVLFDLDGQSRELPNSNWSSAFRGCTDVLELTVRSRDEAHDTCLQLRNADRALRFVLHLLDESYEDQAELAEATERLLESDSVFSSVSAALYVDSLPSTDSTVAVLRECDNLARLQTLLKEVLNDQPLIRKVRVLFEQADVSEFESEAACASFRKHIFQSSVQKDLVRLIRDQKDIEFLLLKLNSTVRNIFGSRRAIESWTANLRKRRVRLPDHSVQEEEISDQESRSNLSTTGRGIFEQIRSQQAAIEQRLKLRNISSAQKFASDLIRGQQSNSSPEQIAKSLSLLSHLAKVNGVPELQLQWAREAVEYNPRDLITFSHLFDALLGQNRLHEASKVIDDAEQLHRGLFIFNARARLLRARGDFEDARKMYLRGAAEFPYDPEYSRALAGSAETLRDMGSYDQALDEYLKLVKSYPTEETFWCGLASVYLDMGQFDKAIQNFGKAIRGKDVVARNGRATAYKHAGQFEQALRIYDQIIRDYPNDEVALCGRAEVYRAKGDISNALLSYELAIERSPFTSGPVRGKFDVLRETGKLDEATKLLEATQERFPDDPILASSYAEILEEKSDWLSALSAYEAVAKNFPRAIGARLGRARILRRINRSADALASYSALVAAQPYLVAAQLGKAATLIELGEYTAAERLLQHPHTPKSLIDWRKHLLTALMLQAQNENKKSKSMFEFGLRKTPFARVKRIYAAALARQKLRNGEPSVAVRVIEAKFNEVSNVVRLHALAAAGRSELALDVWGRISPDDANIELATEIARRFRIIDQAPRHDLVWIYNIEERALLLEAA